MQSKIDKMGVGRKVLTMRKTLTCSEIADIVNERYLPAGEQPISMMAVSRYCTSHGMADMERNDISKDVTHFDALGEAEKVRRRLVKHSNKLESMIDDLKEDEEKLSELSSISNAYLASLRQLEDLNESVSKIQKEQLGLTQVRKVLQAVLDTLNKYPQVRTEVFEKLRQSDVYDTIRAI